MNPCILLLGPTWRILRMESSRFGHSSIPNIFAITQWVVAFQDGVHEKCSWYIFKWTYHIALSSAFVYLSLPLYACSSSVLGAYPSKSKARWTIFWCLSASQNIQMLLSMHSTMKKTQQPILLWPRVRPIILYFFYLHDKVFINNGPTSWQTKKE